MSTAALTLAAALHAQWLHPQAVDFAQQSAHLAPAIEAVCVADDGQEGPLLLKAQQQWINTLRDWERLSAAALGAVLERRAQRQIDFSPTRPKLIEKAVKSAPASAADMERIGTPAKGLPALEWLLWHNRVPAGSPECAYAVQVAAEIAREAEALAAAPAPELDDAAMLSEWLNQWIGGLERLRWTGLEMPARVVTTGGAHGAPDYPRRLSGASAVAWAAQWASLRAQAIGPAGLGAAHPATLHAALVARGEHALAESLARAAAEADARMQTLNPGNPIPTNNTSASLPRVLEAAQSLSALKRLAEDKIAPALGVNIGFSDADGD